MVHDKKLWVSPLVFTLTVLLACAALFGSLTIWDNKYSQTASRPENGVLSITEQSLQETPVRYLVYGWELYPGQLLTSDELLGAQSEETFIGQYGGMEMDDLSLFPHGSATYRLTLLLPEEETEYAISLPEIFSAYRLYLNGNLVAQSGNPDPSEYESGIQNRIVSFRGSGKTEMVIAVTDESGLYSGMVYPPAFGELQPVLFVRYAQLLLHLTIVLAALLGIAASLYFGKRSSYATGIFSCLLCLCLVVITGYPLLHTFFMTGYFPWYPIEITCYSCMLLLAVVLQSHLCGIQNHTVFFFALPCAVGVVAAAFYSFGAGVLDAAAMQVFSVCVTIVKFYTAGYLLAVSVYAISKQKKFSYVLFGAGLVFAAALLFDRIFPLYEPIIGCFFPEIGGLALAIAFECVLWTKLSAAYRFQATYEAQHIHLEQQLAMQKEHYRQLSGQVEKARIAAHDLRHHMRALHELSHKGAYGQIEKYLENYEPNLAQQEVVTFTSHPTADAVLNYYASRVKQSGAVFDARLVLPEELNFPDDELCILLSNLLENAADAVSRQKSGERFIYLRGEQSDGKIRLVADNSFDGMIQKEEGRFLSSKRRGFGTGILSVQSLVQRFGGLASFDADGKVFRVSIMIPLPEHPAEKS
ncbi:MAG: ATP-binding protein [Christensenella sp.]|nr:ATP-binding protein [Christensenella sp.]